MVHLITFTVVLLIFFLIKISIFFAVLEYHVNGEYDNDTVPL